MTNAQQEREYFWNKFYELVDKENDFFIKFKVGIECGFCSNHAHVWYDKAKCYVCFNLRDKKIYVGAPLTDNLLANKDKISEIIERQVLVQSGPKNKNIKNLCISFDFIAYDKENYVQVLNENFRTIISFARQVNLHS